MKYLSTVTNELSSDVKQSGRNTIELTALDLHIGVVTIIFEFIEEKYIRSEIVRRNNSAVSTKKAAIRANGTNGGRPKKLRIETEDDI